MPPGARDLGEAASREVITDAADSWTSQECADLDLSAGPDASSPRLGDSISSIAWIESDWPYDPAVIGLTRTQYDVDGTGAAKIVEADIALNAEGFRWTHGAASGAVNATAVVLHELGHFLGLGHSADPNATMYFAYGASTSGLAVDDVHGICSLYPSQTADCTETGCSTGYHCESPTCVRDADAGGLCAACTSGIDCMDGVCLGYPDGRGYCATECETSADCGTGTCLTISGLASRQCVRFADGVASCRGTGTCAFDSACEVTERCDPTSNTCVPQGTGASLGEACSTSSDCASSTCFLGTCTRTCDWLAPASCSDGFHCNGLAAGQCGLGLCMPGVAGTGALDAPCETASDCASLFCSDGRCSEPCIPEGTANCTSGHECHESALAGCGACHRVAPIGESCSENPDCASGACRRFGGVSVCSADCSSSACPTGFTCRADDEGVSACAPVARADGSACASSLGCTSGLCLDSTCATACIEGACPAGEECVASDGGTPRCVSRSAAACACSTGSSTGLPAGPAAWILGGIIMLGLRRRRTTRRCVA